MRKKIKSNHSYKNKYKKSIQYKEQDDIIIENQPMEITEDNYMNFVKVTKDNYMDLNLSDENLKIVGFYQELLTNEEINNPENQEDKYDEQEIKDAFDIDEYEYNDDFDETMDAFET